MTDVRRPGPPASAEPAASTAAGPLTPPPADAAAAGTIAATFDEQVAELAPLYAAAGRVLTWGFRLSAALLAAGLLLALIRDEPLAEEAEPLPEVIPLVLDGHGAGLVDLAIVAMVLTPVATVVVIAAGFLRLGDRRYALVTLVVLAILGVSVTLSLLR